MLNEFKQYRQKIITNPMLTKELWFFPESWMRSTLNAVKTVLGMSALLPNDETWVHSYAGSGENALLTHW